MAKWTKILAAVLGIFIGAFVLSGSGAPSYAQVVAPTDVLTPEEVFRFKKFLENTKPADFADAARRKEILSRNIPKAVPNYAPHLIKVGALAAVATGIWSHNILALHTGLSEGPEMIVAGLDVKPSSGALSATGRSIDNSAVACEAFVTSATWKVVGSNITGTLSTSAGCPNVKRTGPSGTGSYSYDYGYRPRFGVTNISVSHYAPANYVVSNTSGVPDYQQDYTMPISGTYSATKSYRMFATDRGPSGETQKLAFTFDTTERTFNMPVFDSGEVTTQNPDTYVPGSSDFATTPQQSAALYDSVVADPETCPAEPGVAPLEPCPDYFPEEWEEEFPDVGEPGPDDDPYGDPDEDGEPNHEDEDDDGDGIPDEDDEEPWVANPDLPEADPDHDGEPNETDDDDDGDGIPDEDDPDPIVPTDPATLPEEHPYADPDEDGQPNRDDTDDDGDGIPDEVDPNPTTPDVDTDGDQDPDETDPDDDGDGIPDEDDPDPIVPTDPATLPEEHPYADPDEDGDSNRRDQDDDGDGMEDWEEDAPFSPQSIPEPAPDTDADDVPDWSDPWPGNPYAPAEPTRDTDTDGVPDYKDPEPTIQDVPWDPDSLTPGNPNMPATPTNPNRPASTRPAKPMDPSNTQYPGTPLDPDAPDSPEVEGSPDPPDTSSCEQPRPVDFDLPNLELDNVFPFVLVIRAWQWMGALTAPPEAPSFDLPFFGAFTVGAGFDSVMTGWRAVVTIVCGIGMCFWFYRYISGKGSE